MLSTCLQVHKRSPLAVSFCPTSPPLLARQLSLCVLVRYYTLRCRLSYPMHPSTSAPHPAVQDSLARTRAPPTAHPEASENVAPVIPPTGRGAKSHARKQSVDHIPRPKNAFILFRTDFVSQSKLTRGVESDHRNISKIVGQLWNELPAVERAKWERLAAAEKAAHKAKYPNYRYAPVYRREGIARRRTKPETEEDKKRCKQIVELLKSGREGKELEKAIASQGGKILTKPKATRKSTRAAARPYRAPSPQSSLAPSPSDFIPSASPQPIIKMESRPGTPFPFVGELGYPDLPMEDMGAHPGNVFQPLSQEAIQEYLNSRFDYSATLVDPNTCTFDDLCSYQQFNVLDLRSLSDVGAGHDLVLPIQTQVPYQMDFASPYAASTSSSEYSETLLSPVPSSVATPPTPCLDDEFVAQFVHLDAPSATPLAYPSYASHGIEAPKLHGFPGYLEQSLKDLREYPECRDLVNAL
ncbi:hypothetical protein BOTBODRAFT_190207 [Botryobasidium botryosum FD-172 SS1]|uniref:HMG box domain-containing protein n=1 Tax=Botryobasidium botryosum (strain FD-172 SS1) TaxID=930990 RepID=A0A067MG96_BOTB1|nr:hypothetical protein BOTBODRAFT_190207 [Botryobasidium botryosum FD-172 SS1]